MPTAGGVALDERHADRPRRWQAVWARGRTATLTLLLCLIWGLHYPIAKVGLRSAAPLTLGVLTVLIGGGLQVLVARHFAPGHARDRRLHRAALVLGLTSIVGLYGLLNIGLESVSAGEASLVVYSQPLLVAIAARLWLGEHGGITRSAGLLVGLVGVALVLSDRIRPGASVPWLAYGCLLAAALGWTAGAVYFKRRAADLDLSWLNALQSLYALPVLLALAALTRSAPPRVDGGLLLVLAYFGGGTFLVGRLLYYTLLRRGEVSVVSAYLFLVPLIAVLAGVLLLGEPLRAPMAFGGALVAAGIYMVNRTAQ